jgi:hypothetical protein
MKYVLRALRKRDEKWYELLVTNPDGKGLPGGCGHKWMYIVTCMSDCRRGFGLEIGFIDHFNTRRVTHLIIAPSLVSTL